MRRSFLLYNNGEDFPIDMGRGFLLYNSGEELPMVYMGRGFLLSLSYFFILSVHK